MRQPVGTAGDDDRAAAEGDGGVERAGADGIIRAEDVRLIADR
jgi:hypothetical protein